MNKPLYKALVAKLKTEVPEVKWIDFDMGQLDVSEDERPAVAFPCVLIDIAYTGCSDLREEPLNTKQQCTVRVSLKTAFENLLNNTSGNTPEAKTDKALEIFDVMDKIHLALQAWTPADGFSTLSRDNCLPVKKKGYKVYNSQYTTILNEEE